VFSAIVFSVKLYSSHDQLSPRRAIDIPHPLIFRPVPHISSPTPAFPHAPNTRQQHKDFGVTQKTTSQEEAKVHGQNYNILVAGLACWPVAWLPGVLMVFSEMRRKNVE